MGKRNPEGSPDELPTDQRLSLNCTPSGESGESSICESSIAGIYARVNTSSREDRNSLELQVEKCRALLESEGYRTSREFVCQEVWSGTDKARPGLARLMADVRSGKVRAVFVYRIDRLSRDPLHLLELFDELLGHDVQLHLVEGTLETLPGIG